MNKEKATVYILALLAILNICLLKYCNEPKTTPTTPLKAKVATLKKAVETVQIRQTDIRIIHDTIIKHTQSIDTLKLIITTERLIHDTIIAYKDSIIHIQDTIIATEPKRQRKAVWRAVKLSYSAGVATGILITKIIEK